WPLVGLEFDRSSVVESDGSNAVIATLTREPISNQPLTVWLVNSLPETLLAPESVVVPAGAETYSFPLGVVDDDVESSTRFAEVRAEVRLADGEVISESMATLEISDDEGPRLEMVFEKGWLLEGESGDVVVRRVDTTLATALSVTLAASVPDQLD